MQFHGTADRYTPTGATTVATLYSDATTATSNPAVTLRSVGVNGGQAAAFTYDLARSVVYTRQGNPAWAGQSRDGQAGPIRSDNLFFGAAAGDPQPDWVDLDKVAIPQADEQQRLLANLIGEHEPRPQAAAALLVLPARREGGRGDDRRRPRQRRHRRALRPVQGAEPGRLLGRRLGVRARHLLRLSQLAAHRCARPRPTTPTGFEVGAPSDDQLRELHAGVARPGTTTISWPTSRVSTRACRRRRTNRTHCIAWSDWATQPKVELDHGIRFDTNYYYWPPAWVDDRPGLFTGSGMPMRFADLDGTMIDVYQAHDPDDRRVGPVLPVHGQHAARPGARQRGLLRRVRRQHAHRQSPARSGSDAIVSSALARGVPVVSAARCSSGSTAATAPRSTASPGAATRSSFTIEVGAGANGLRAMVPVSSEAGRADRRHPRRQPGRDHQRRPSRGSSTRSSKRSPATTRRPMTSTRRDRRSPTSPTPPALSSATITWDTNEPSDSRVDYGTSPSALTSSESSAALATSHSIELDGLAANTTYYYRVTSADGAANSTTDPAAAEPPRSFSTPAAGLTDTTAADFAAGSPGADGYVAETADGEVTLKPAVGEEFSGAFGLPSGWSSATWESQGGGAGGSATVSGGSLHVERRLARAPTPPSGPAGRSSSPPPSAPPRSSTSASATTSTAPGRSSAPTTSPVRSSLAPTRALPRSTPRSPGR